LEIGSRNYNGTVRDLFRRHFRPLSYWGIDLQPGPGVDQAVDAAEYDGRAHFDLVVCCEVLEHAADPMEIIDCAARALRPGGRLLLTCAGLLRPPHGADGGLLREGETYNQIRRDQLLRWLRPWAEGQLTSARDGQDLYVSAIR
jgi:SAM-dependent methyltransferase